MKMTADDKTTYEFLLKEITAYSQYLKSEESRDPFFTETAEYDVAICKLSELIEVAIQLHSKISST